MTSVVLAVGLLGAFLTAPFWETYPPEEWADSEIEYLLTSSPWVAAQQGAHIYLASALPMWQAEQQKRLRMQSELDRREDTSIDEYLEFMQDHRGEYIVVAVGIPLPQFLARKKETKSMENKSVLVVRKKKYKIVGHFPPTPGDHYLRLVFPRVVEPSDEVFYFDLYVPGVPMPFRRVIYQMKSLQYKGAPEY